MQPDYIQSLYGYNTWANQRVLETAAKLPTAQLLAETHVSFGSLRDALVHLVSVQRVWLARAQGHPTPAALAPALFPDLPAIAAAWQTIDADTHAFIRQLAAGDLEQTIRYTNSKGEPNAYLLWHILFHQASHAAQHRSEIALLLTEMGCSTGWLDYLVYLDLAATGL